MKLIKHIAFVALLLLLAIPAWAYDFEVDGICYNITSDSEVEVTKRTDGFSYSDYYGDVIIPEMVSYNGIYYSVTCIGSYAFYGCSGLTSISIPNSVSSIGRAPFFNCQYLASIIVDPENTKYDSRNDCNAIIDTESNSLVIGCKNTVIPSTVVEIGFEAFVGCLGLTSIIIPNSVTDIGGYAFYECTGLTTVTIPNSIISIGYGAFENCSELNSIDFPNTITSIGYHAFKGCSKLVSIMIPSFVRSIGGGAFSGCSGLSSIIVAPGNTMYDSRGNCNAIINTETNVMIAGCKSTIVPDSVTSIGYEAFYGCSDLTSINIPNSVVSIEYMAFAGCSGLTSMVIPNSVMSIESGAFANCRGITSMCMPNSITAIEDGVFMGCKGLISVILGENVSCIGQSAFFRCDGLVSLTIMSPIPPTVKSNCFSNPSNITLNIPCNSLEMYQSDEYWSLFANLVENISLVHFEVLSSDVSLGTVRIIGQPDCENKAATVIAEPIGNHPFLNWTKNGQVVSTANPYTFVVEENMELVGNFQGTGIDESAEQRVSVSPNPTKNTVNIGCENMKGVSVYTLDGRMSKTYDVLNADAFTLDMSDVPQGVYVLRVDTREGIVINRKIIKE